MTSVYNWKNEIKENELNNVIEALKNNELVILPTETVYGLAANAFSDEACKKIFIVKGRAQDNPLPRCSPWSCTRCCTGRGTDPSSPPRAAR